MKKSSENKQEQEINLDYIIYNYSPFYSRSVGSGLTIKFNVNKLAQVYLICI